MKRDVFLVGAKSIGQYGGYESFVKNLIDYSLNCDSIAYHVTCKKNGEGYMNLDNLESVKKINDNEFYYKNAHGFMINVNEKLGPAQAIYYDLSSLDTIIKYIKSNSISDFIVYVLACRIGPFFKKYVNIIHSLGGMVYINPDGHEWKRTKWSPAIRRYWKLSERLMVKNSDLIVCDSQNIEKYIQKEYCRYNPNTTFIAYGSDTKKSTLEDDDKEYNSLFAKYGINDLYYTVIGRCVPENNIETIIREFILSKTTKDLLIITTENKKYMDYLNNKYKYKNDKRIKCIGTVYNQELLKKIREKSFAYIHGHSVGGTNPSLLESLGLTKLNLLYDVSFNREVACESGLYWNLKEGNLSNLINEVDSFDTKKINTIGNLAKDRINNYYSWNIIVDKYCKIFSENL